MSYGSFDSGIGSVMDRYITGNYGEDDYEEGPEYFCSDCGRQIYEDEDAYSDDGRLFCEKCFKEWLFEHFAEDYQTDLDKWS